MSQPDHRGGEAPGPQLAFISPVRTIRPAPGTRPGPAPLATTPKEALQRGETWWADCPRCKCAGRIDLEALVGNGRGDVGADTLRCANCKHPDISVRITSAPALRSGCCG